MTGKKIGSLRQVTSIPAAPPPNAPADPITLVFDGQCGLCTGWVAYLVAQDRGLYLRFAALTTSTGMQLRATRPTAVLVARRGDTVAGDSQAILMALAVLPRWSRLARAARWLPAWPLDKLIHLLSARRHWFAAKARPCTRSDPTQAWRFIQD